MRTSTLWTLVAVITLPVGCEAPNVDVVDSEPAATEQPESKEVDLFSKDDWYLPDGRVDMTGVPGEPPMTTNIPREVTAKDPKKGKLTRKKGGSVLGTTLKALPWAEFETKFQMVKYNMEQYNAIKGHYPKSHEEFMDEYMPEFCPQLLPLPELEPGDEYIYDPEDHLLKIYRPDD